MCITLLVTVLRVQGCCHGGCTEHPSASRITVTVLANGVTDSSEDTYMCIIILFSTVHLLSTLYDLSHTITKFACCCACVSKYIVVTQALEDTVSIAIICAISYARRKKSSLIVNSPLERSGFLSHE